MKIKPIYVTFYERTSMTEKKKFAVECLTEYQAQGVAMDACYLTDIGNVRIRKSGKPKDRQIIKHNNYYKYKWY